MCEKSKKTFFQSLQAQWSQEGLTLRFTEDFSLEIRSNVSRLVFLSTSGCTLDFLKQKPKKQMDSNAVVDCFRVADSPRTVFTWQCVT